MTMRRMYRSDARARELKPRSMWAVIVVDRFEPNAASDVMLSLHPTRRAAERDLIRDACSEYDELTGAERRDFGRRPQTLAEALTILDMDKGGDYSFEIREVYL